MSKKLSYRIRATVLLGCVSLLGAGAAAQQVDPQQVGPPDVAPEGAGIPAEIQDAAFDRYVDLELLLEAWETLDAAALADAGLQLAEGERILFRSHKAITADEVLAAASRVAGEKRDTETLQRLSMAAEALEKNGLATAASAALKLVSQSRTIAGPTILLDELTPVNLAVYRASTEAIEDARIRGDSKELDEFAKELTENSALPAEIKKHLSQLNDGARSAIKTAAGKQPHTLGKLSGPSRYNGTWRVRNENISNPYGQGNTGVYVRVNKGTPRRIPKGYWRTFTYPLGRRSVQVLRTDGTWHGISIYPGRAGVFTSFGVYYVKMYFN